MSELAILHLSDMHFRNTNSYYPDTVRYIVNALHDNVIGIANLLMLITGDLAYSGSEEQYRDVDGFLEALVSTICEREKQIKDIRVFTVPGNHDLDNTNGKLNAEKLKRIVSSELQDDYLESEFRKLVHYSDFAKDRSIITDENALIESCEIEFDDEKILINLINTAPFSVEGKGDEDKHYMPKAELSKLMANNNIDYIFTLMHHPHYWFDWNSKHELIHALVEKSDMIFVGHEHYSACKNVWDDRFSARFQEGGKLSNLGNWEGSEFFVGVLEFKTRKYCAKKYKWNHAGQAYFPEAQVCTVLSKNRWNQFGFALNQDYERAITIDERFLVGQDIRSYYVFPTIEEDVEVKERRPISMSSMDQLIDFLKPGKKVIIKGARESGKTALAHQIFLATQRENMSVLLDETDFYKVAVEKESIEEAIQGAIKREYRCDETTYEKYIQESADKKIIIIDNFDAIHKSVQYELIAYIEGRYGVIVLTRQRDIQLKMVERARTEKLLEDYQEFFICPFYRSKREQLIERVVEVRAKNVEEQDIIQNVVKRLLIGSRQLFRWDPTFIIQISIYASDNVQTIRNKEGNVFGTVFLHTILNLLNPELEKMKIDPDYALTIIDKIAYAAYKKKLTILPAELVQSVVAQYLSDYKYNACNPVDFVKCLEQARIIRTVNGGYCFCQTTYFAFFVAREIRRIFQDKNDFSDFTNAIMEAYHPINLSVVLFVLYIMDSGLLIEQVKNLAERSMDGLDEFRSKNPKQKYFSDMSYSMPNLVEGEREEYKTAQDENEKTLSIQNQEYWIDTSDPDVESQKMSLRLSLLIIVSQILPNLGHIITGDKKMEFVNLIYSMPLKLFNLWASDIEDDKVSLIQDIKQVNMLEYRSRPVKEMTDAEAVQYLRTESLRLLLELMDLSIGNAGRSTTFDLLDEFNHRQNVDYDIEWLISHEKRNDPNWFIAEADRICKENKSGIPNVMTKSVVKHYLLTNRALEYRHIQQINSMFFDGKLPLRLIYIDHISREKQ